MSISDWSSDVCSSDLKGDKINAAADINTVRARAQATDVAADEVDVDYILDERAREVVVEEPRRLTLARLGLLDERIKLPNPVRSAERRVGKGWVRRGKSRWWSYHSKNKKTEIG